MVSIFKNCQYVVDQEQKEKYLNVGGVRLSYREGNSGGK